MRKLVRSLSVIPVIAILAIPLHAQHGGRSRGMDESTLGRTSFETPDKKLAFTVPPDVALFTPDSPGTFGQVFKSGYIAYLTNLMDGEVKVGIKPIPGATEADLNGLRQTLDTRPPQATQSGYKKLSLAAVKVGTGQDKEAVEYIYTADSNNKPITTRQVMFLHAGQGYVITCSAPEKEFASVNKKTFDPLFEKLELR